MEKVRTFSKRIEAEGFSRQRARGWLVVLAFMATYLIWGSTYLAVLFGLEGFPPFMLAGFRFLVAGAILLAWCLARGEKLPGIRGFATSSLSGVLMLAGGTGSVIWAEQYISSGMAAILIALEPFWFIALDRKSWRAYFSNRLILLGLIIGLGGFLLLFLWPAKAGAPAGTAEFTGTLVLLAGGISWVVGSLYARSRSVAGSVWFNSSLQLLAAGVFCLLGSTIAGEWERFILSAVPLRAWLALAYLALMGSVVAYTAFIWLLTVRPPAVVGTHTYVNPVVAVVLGWLFANEPVLLSQVMALPVILAGVLLVSLPNYQKDAG